VALLWKDKHPMFEIENANARVRNLITFQLITGDKRFYFMAIYIVHRTWVQERGGRPQECLGAVSYELYTACHWGLEY
jgi:hypothetical protein